jgi:prevent-host-death family protein
MNEWQLQDAKARFSELVKRAVDDGPQTVTVRGERTAVLLSAAEYDRLMRPPKTLLEVLTGGPPWDEQMHQDVEYRDRSPPRDIEL